MNGYVQFFLKFVLQLNVYPAGAKLESYTGNKTSPFRADQMLKMHNEMEIHEFLYERLIFSF